MPVIQGKEVGPIGYGLMSITAPGASDSDDVGFAAIKAAIEAGCTYLNGGEFYGTPERNSLIVLNRYLEKYPEDASKILLNIKGTVKPGYQTDGSAENVKASVNNCVNLLGPKGYIDQFEPARRDKKVPLEETIGTLRDLVAEGKIGGVALSEVNANSIRGAAKITKIIAVEIELSLWETAPLTNGVLEACKELDIAVIAYGTLGHGFLGGKINSLDDLSPKDFRNLLPRFQEEHFNHNLALLKELKRLASEKKCTEAQLALAWVLTLAKRPDMPTIIPIPGSISVERIRENVAAINVELSDDEMKQIDEMVKRCGVSGDRYHKHGMDSLDV